MWGPDALVKAPVYLRTTAAQRDEAAQAAASLTRAEERVARLEDAIARGDKDPVGRQAWTLAPPARLDAQLEAAQRQLTNLRAASAASTS